MHNTQDLFFGGQKKAPSIDPTGKAMGHWKSEAEASVWKIGSQTNRFCCSVKKISRRGRRRVLGRTRLSFRGGRWKICVAGPCGDAFVCVGLSEEMSHRAAQAWRAILRAAAAGRTDMVDTY